MATIQTDVPLNQRLEKIKEVFFLREREDSSQRQLDTQVLIARTVSYERHLTNLGIVPEDYTKVYELARLIYVQEGTNGPFGINEVLKGAQNLKELKKQATRFSPEAKVDKIPCQSCDGTGLEYSRKADGSLGKIQYEVIKGKKRAKHCLDCYER